MSAKKVTDLREFLRRCEIAAQQVKYYQLGPDHAVIPATRDEWTVMFMDAPGRTVAKTAVDGAEVSTVFLGLDHGFSEIRGGPPIVFETMVFANSQPGLDVDMDRYATWDEAVEGHAAMVRKTRNKVVQFRRRQDRRPAS